MLTFSRCESISNAVINLTVAQFTLFGGTTALAEYEACFKCTGKTVSCAATEFSERWN